MPKEKKLTASQRWNKEKMKLYAFRFSRSKEADIIARIDSQENKKGYIARLIREDMRRDENN